ncbi:MAG: tetratricopeptide repeat protein [Candidatus Choladocola sp.]|nr:tetratricopeptide repeat protein [Candidatus Choladocola sp.]
MKCIYCNTPLAAIDYCPGCGADITIQKRIVRISNLLYNEGLEKALVRDMEGAITCLKRSLKFNKENTDARNLLGLCYYETGEAVSALCEWVVSKNLKQENNLADHYINQLQNNKNKLDTINQTIRKYNQSVLYCREDNEDMAIIQLKKVISQNPKLVKAYQLLALLYMKRQEYERARKLLKKAAYIDTTNTTTLRYLQEIEDVTGKGTSLERKNKKYGKDVEERVTGTLRYMSGTEMVIQPTTFRDSSTIATFINIILGILLGGAIVWFLVVPANRQAVNDAANRQVTDANTKLATESVKVQELQDEIDGYVDQAEKADKDRDDALAKAAGYEDLMAVAKLYVSGDQSTAASMITNLNADDFDGNAKALYEALNSAVKTSLFDQYYNAGTVAYMAQDYTTAADQLKKAVDADSERESSRHYDALLYLGMACYYLGDQAGADAAFNQIVEYYPAQAANVQGYISSSSGSTASSRSAEDLSGVGDAATGQYADSGTSGQGGTDDITVYNDQPTYEDGLYAAWTDPNTGLQYDVNGNLLPGQQ